MTDEQSSQRDDSVPAMTDEHRWGEPITAERRDELDGYLQRWADEESADGGTRPGERTGPFAGATADQWGVHITGADVFYLAARALAGSMPAEYVAGALAKGVAVAGMTRDDMRIFLDLSALHLEGANLNEAHLEGAHIEQAHLEGASFSRAHLEGASFSQAHLEGASFSQAHLEGVHLEQTHLEGADLSFAHLEGARLLGTHLEGARLEQTHLERAILFEAHLEGASFSRARLEGADLTGASFDKSSRLYDAVLTGASFDQVTFDNTNLTVVDWSLVDILGDERTARAPKDAGGKPKARDTRLREFKAAVRANRVLSVALRAQGLNEDADRFDYRAQLLQRQVLRRQGKPGRAFGSWLLDIVAGYGYNPFRSIVTYLLVVTLFGLVYWAVGVQTGHTLTWNEAGVVSLTAFHGRGFFATAFSPGDPQAALAAIEAVIGLLIEITFIATFTQRFFAR